MPSKTKSVVSESATTEHRTGRGRDDVIRILLLMLIFVLGVYMALSEWPKDRAPSSSFILAIMAVIGIPTDPDVLDLPSYRA